MSTRTGVRQLEVTSSSGSIHVQLKRYLVEPGRRGTLRTLQIDDSTSPFSSTGSAMGARVESKLSVVSARTERERRWRPLLLAVLVLGNLLYVGLGIALTTQSPNKMHLRNDILLDDIMYFRTYTDNAASLLAAATNESHVAATDVPSNSSRVRRLACRGWKATGGCSPDGPRKPEQDKDCTSKIPGGSSGYCEVEDKETHEVFRVMKRTCATGKPGVVFRCIDAPGFTNFRAETHQVVNKVSVPGFKLLGMNESSDKIQGIVMVVYPELIASAYATIRALREILSCQLPIEIWFRPDEIRRVPGALDPLKGLAANGSAKVITFREINDPRAIRYGAKIHAIYHSGFEQVLFLDADNVPVKDPTYLFKTPEFLSTGAVFWPDYWHPQHSIFFIDENSLVWQLLDLPFVDMFEQESGQLLINRRRHAGPIELVAFYAKHRPDYFSRLGLAWGDKDLFRFAWLKLGAPFHMIEFPPAVAGKVYGKSFCGMTMVQHDPQGEVTFLHRNQLKLTGKPTQDKPAHAFSSHTTNAVEYPDPAMWTHLLSFRNTSPRSSYIIWGHWEPQFSDKRRCFGRSDLDGDSNFYTQRFIDLDFSSMETYLRKFAMEAAQYREHNS
ncbi:hypothetical protein ON010_g11713 [Phytophthora cinnamomi]|nr:hypothetical protein ON010_g11713 [Phytophthora cinnamomi]